LSSSPSTAKKKKKAKPQISIRKEIIKIRSRQRARGDSSGKTPAFIKHEALNSTPSTTKKKKKKKESEQK
jgi:hypothetical protein